MNTTKKKNYKQLTWVFPTCQTGCRELGTV